jgi:hypothetical protein
MEIRRPLVYIDGESAVLPAEDIIEFSPLFSYKRIQAGKKLVVFDHQQMIVKGDIRIDGDLKIELEGEVWQL